MAIHFIKEDAKETLKANIVTNLKNYKQPSAEGVVAYIGEDCFVEYKGDIETIDFDMSSDKPFSLDWKNSILLHKALVGISRVDATDERFWVGLAHKDCWEFMQYRYSLETNDITTENILPRYFFTNGQKRSLYVHTLSKMWWLAESIYDDKNDNPYWLMDFFKTDLSTKVLILFSNNFTSNKEILIGLISALIALENKGLKISREYYYDACAYLNIIGGNMILDYCSREDIYNDIFNRYVVLIK